MNFATLKNMYYVILACSEHVLCDSFETEEITYYTFLPSKTLKNKILAVFAGKNMYYVIASISKKSHSTCSDQAGIT